MSRRGEGVHPWLPHKKCSCRTDLHRPVPDLGQHNHLLEDSDENALPAAGQASKAQRKKLDRYSFLLG